MAKPIVSTPVDEAAVLALRHSKLTLADELLKLRAQVARMEAENARLRAVAPLPSGAPLLSVSVPILIMSEPNQRGLGWGKKSARTAKHRKAVTAALCSVPFSLGGGPRTSLLSGSLLLDMHPRLSVHLERRSVGQLDDDNLAAGCKAARDSVAAWLGCDDGPRGPLVFSYSQQAHKRWANCPELLIEMRALA